MNRASFIIFITVIILSGCEPFSGEQNKPLPKREPESTYFYPLTATDQIGGDLYHTVYVPVYSHIFISGGGRLNMAVTLIVRNTDFIHPLVIKAVRYFDTGGQVIGDYLPEPHVLAPMASTYFFIEQTDIRGGVGANFIVQWAADESSNTPVIDAVMAGATGTQGFSFSSQGREIKGQDFH
jgi:hypothetical protein